MLMAFVSPGEALKPGMPGNPVSRGSRSEMTMAALPEEV
jgi:hypothetical protein